MAVQTQPQTTWQPMPLSIATSIASHSLSTPESLQIEIDQTTHRLQLLNFFHVPASSHILEIGCGQGTCTVVLGHAVGEDGHVDAIDPAPLDYGAPYTLGQAQQHIAKGALGGRVKFWQAQIDDFLKETGDKKWDYAVFVHCLWYLDAPETLARMLKALKGRVNRVCIAEYAMKASEPAAVPHVLAALTRATFEAQRPDSQANIRCLLSPPDIKSIAGDAGWKIERETEIVPHEGLQDGGWEVGDVKSKSFLDDIEQCVADNRIKVLLRSGREAVVRAVQGLDDTKVRTMDVWAATFYQGE
ncbi:SAM-dependent methyltransferase [Fusarium agapanthi]|uniref:SAM-dependent methyltransferase n=1 Tax=Fusarium agapanthi TaxID=1803897 RepID=A0A9P5BCK3_9HYPO|nr:SAM-dependent methyltransferase [Fusarium agapanthi]